MGLSLHSNGYGADFRYGKRLDGFNKRLYEVKLSYIKHPKEIKSHNQMYENESFVFGKTNHFLNIQASIGRQKEIFSKEDKGSIAIRYFYNIGLSAGILKPIYYEVLYYNISTNKPIFKNEKFDVANHHNTYDIYGKAPFTEGLSESTITPGLHLKMGFNFEYSKTPRVLNAIECGVVLDAFLKQMEIMATHDKDRFYLTLFVTYRFGKLFSPRVKIDE